MFVSKLVSNPLSNSAMDDHPAFIYLAISVLSLVLILQLLLFARRKHSRKIFLLDFACYKPRNDKDHRLNNRQMIEKSRRFGGFSVETLEFMSQLLEKTGLGNSTYFPLALTRDPPNPCLNEARKEAMDVVFGSIDDVLEKTRVKCKDIGILVVNCCIFNVVPSLSSMVVNKYKLRDSIISYQLGGMGCSGGLKAIGLAQHLLRVHPNTCALVVSTENITENWYRGNNRAMQIINCLFRVGGAVIILSNRPSDQRSSKYELIHTVHTHTGSHDESYNIIYQEEDEDGRVGININKQDLPKIVIRTVKANIEQVGRLILPTCEQILFLVNQLMRRYHVSNIKPYVPKFDKAFDHFFPHVGGKAILDEMEKILGFSEAQMEAARMTLYRFGNTSSSSIWYELAYAEAKGRIKKGNQVWQIAMGSGFKCSSAMWRVMRTVDCKEKNVWTDEIDQFPVDLGSIQN